jgi:3-hydroxybutyrate dehydrogenase
MKKCVLITGGTSGIGLGIAREFARTGQYNLALNGLENNGEEIAQQIAKEFTTDVLFDNANLMYPEQIRELVKKTEERFGKVDVLVCNAGIQHVAPVEEFPEEKWDAIIRINLSSAFHLTKAVWPGMKKRNFGRIINIASAHGLVASEFKSAYIASKHGIIGFTKTIALEGAPFNITANAICPGYVRTPLVEKQIADQARSHGIPESEVIQKVMLYKQAVKDFIPVELLGKLAVFLASDEAKTLTGTALPVDGGWNAQ